MQIEHTTPVISQTQDIAASNTHSSVPQTDYSGKTVIEIDKIFAHRCSEKGFQNIALPCRAPSHEAFWKPTDDYVDPDGTISQGFHE